MVTERAPGAAHALSSLRAKSWVEVERGIHAATAWLQTAPVGSADAGMIVDALVQLATHDKWEVRRAVALAAGETRHPGLDGCLVRLARDGNARVQQAAQSASLRRRDWRTAGMLGREHERRIEGMLEGVHVRFGVQGRMAVYRVAGEMTNTFARELYHEVIKYITPLQRETDELRKLQTAAVVPELVERVQRIERDVGQLRAVLNAMREYAALPELVYTNEGVHAITSEAIRTVGTLAEAMRVDIINNVDVGLEVEVSRTRFVQALSNLLHNAVEAYAGVADREPIEIDADAADGTIVVRVRDRGCGMIPEAQADARTLFCTSKPQGTGLGLPLAIKIIESEHDGRLEMESDAGMGSLITVTLPRYRSPGG